MRFGPDLALGSVAVADLPPYMRMGVNRAVAAVMSLPKMKGKK
jgi:hypothetical protein